MPSQSSADGGGAGLRVRGVVYVAITDEEVRHTIVRGLRKANVELVLLQRFDAIAPQETRDRRSVVLFGASDADGVTRFERLVAMRDVDHWTSALLCVGRPSRDLVQLPQYVRAGLDDLLLCRGEAAEAEIARQVRASIDHNLGSTLTEAVLGTSAGWVRRERGLILRRSFTPMDAREIAERMGVTPKTHRQRHRRLGSVGPHRWIQLCRLIHVAHQIDETGSALTTIARRLRFASESDMSKFVHRLTGASPSALRQEGAIRRALQLVCGEVGGSE